MELSQKFCLEHKKWFPGVPYAYEDHKIISTANYGKFRLSITVGNTVVQTHLIAEDGAYHLFDLDLHDRKFGLKHNRFFKSLKSLTLENQLSIKSFRKCDNPSMQELLGESYYKKYRRTPNTIVVFSKLWSNHTTQITVGGPRRIVVAKFTESTISIWPSTSHCVRYEYGNPASLEKLDELLKEVGSCTARKTQVQLPPSDISA